MVFIIARPLKNFSPFASVSHGFILSHWAVLVCSEEWTAEKMRDLLSNLNSNKDLQDDKLGVLYECSRAQGTNGISSSSTVNVSNPFTIENLVESFTNSDIAFVGVTGLDTQSISNKGTPISTLAQVRRGNSEDISRLQY
jgi:hypothetical protein